MIVTHLIHTCSDTNRDNRKMKPKNFLYLITCKAFDIHCLYTIKLECQMSSICAQLCNDNKQRYLNTSKKDNSLFDFFVFFLENFNKLIYTSKNRLASPYKLCWIIIVWQYTLLFSMFQVLNFMPQGWIFAFYKGIVVFPSLYDYKKLWITSKFAAQGHSNLVVS